MLRATMNSNGMWRRNDGKGAGATYTVSGTPAEIEAFRKAQGQYLIEDKTTGAVLFVRREFSTINGQRVRNLLRPTLKLGILRDGNGVFVDESTEYLQRDAAIEQATITEAGKLAALQLMGVNIGSTTVQQAPPRERVAEGQDETPEQMLAKLQAEADANGSNIGGGPAPEKDKVAEPAPQTGTVGALS